MKNFFTIILLTLFLATTVSCGSSNIATWHTNYDEALEIAKAENKAVVVFFSGDGWDNGSEMLKKQFYETDEFCKAVAKNFVLVNLNFTQNNEEGQFSEDFQEKYMIAQKYKVNRIPGIFVATYNGNVVEAVNINYQEHSDPVKVAKIFNTYAKRAKIITNALEKLQTIEGFARVKIINKLYEACSKSHLFEFNNYFSEVLTLDPTNKSGLLGRYKLHRAYTDSMTDLSEGNLEQATNRFLILTEEPDLLKNLEKQEAYYNIAFLYYVTQEPEFYNLIGHYLQKAYEAAPKSELAPTLAKILKDYNTSDSNDISDKTENTQENTNFSQGDSN